MKNEYYVYEWYNTETGEVFYVGKGKRYRYNEKNYGRNIFFKRYVRKYKCNVRKVRENLTDEEACSYEIELIAYYRQIKQAKCNISDGGDSGNGLCGENHPLSKPIVQLDLQGNFIKEWINVSEAMESTGLRSIYNAVEGSTKRCGKYLWFTKEYYEDNKENISPYSNRQFHYKNMPIIQLDLDGEFINEFLSISDAESETYSDHRHISECCRGKRITCNGFRWMYKKDYESNNNKAYNIKEVKNGIPKRIVQLSLDNQYIKTWESAMSIEKELKIYNSQIIRVCRKKGISAKGFKWIYEKEYLEKSR